MLRADRGCFYGGWAFSFWCFPPAGGPGSGQSKLAQMGPQVTSTCDSPSWPFGTPFPPAASPSSVVCSWGGHPPASDQQRGFSRPQLRPHTHRQAAQLKLELCRRLGALPPKVVPTHGTARGGPWIELASPLDRLASTPESGPCWLANPTPCWPPLADQRQRRGRARSCCWSATAAAAHPESPRPRRPRPRATPCPRRWAPGCGAWPATSTQCSSASPTVSRSGPRCWPASPHDIKTPLTPPCAASLSLLPLPGAVRQKGRSKAEAEPG